MVVGVTKSKFNGAFDAFSRRFVLSMQRLQQRRAASLRQPFHCQTMAPYEDRKRRPRRNITPRRQSRSSWPKAVNDNETLDHLLSIVKNQRNYDACDSAPQEVLLVKYIFYLAPIDFLSRSSKARLRSRPQRYPASVPSWRTARWQGIATAIRLVAQAWATARAAFGWPIRNVSSV